MPKISNRKWKKVNRKLTEATEDLKLSTEQKQYWDWLMEKIVDKFEWYLNKNRQHCPF